MILPTITLLLLQAAQGVQAYPGAGRPSVPVPRIAAEPAIDGDLADSSWQKAARLTGFNTYQPASGRAATEETEVRVMYSRSAIYFAVTSRTPNRKANATLAKRDNIGNDDRFIIYLDTFNDRRRAFMFGANPLGVQLDGVRSDAGVSAGSFFGGSMDFNPDYHFESQGRITDDGYEVEMRIPFRSLRFPSSPEQVWGINISRFNPSGGTEDTWTDATPSAASFLAQSATLVGIRDIDRGIVTEAQPFVTSSLDGTRDEGTGAFDRDSPNTQIGANLRVGFSAVSLDATLNPDFSQVETDAGLVTVNERFALFLPEKRPFFLEGIELFGGPGIFLSGGLSQLVYTRQIASPIAGGKVTGKIGRFGVAYLTALDDTPHENALFNIARLRTDLGGSSVLGFTATDRRQGSTSNSVASADTRVVFRDVYYVEAQAALSRTTRGTAIATSPMFKAELDRTGRTWGFNVLLAGVGDDFESQAGFIPRTDMVTAHVFNRIAFYGKTSASPIQSISIFGGPTRFWRYRHFDSSTPEEGEVNAMLMANLRGGWMLNATAARQFFTFDTASLGRFRVLDSGGQFVRYAPATRIDGLTYLTATLTTPVFATFNANASANVGDIPIFGEGSRGRELRLTASLGVRPSQGIRVEGQLTRSRIARHRDASEYARTTIPRLKAEYQPARALFFRVISELRDERIAAPRDATNGSPLYLGDSIASGARLRMLRTDWLISFEPAPGTVAFFGYGSMHDNQDSVRLERIRRASDGFFIKLAYQFRS
ncbi:MAG: hypothetical protein MNPFHGCM_00668 [Gemmatimonadaceae bacterium]|nr:hypothetical protein [Gemmatimonadaceae bacterium]